MPWLRRPSCRARATRRYAANDGARNVDFECFSVRTAPGRLIRCRCSAIQNNVQANTYDLRRPGATPSLLSCRPSPPSLSGLCSAKSDAGRRQADRPQPDVPKSSFVGSGRKLTDFLWSCDPGILGREISFGQSNSGRCGDGAARTSHRKHSLSE